MRSPPHVDGVFLSNGVSARCTDSSGHGRVVNRPLTADTQQRVPFAHPKPVVCVVPPLPPSRSPRSARCRRQESLSLPPNLSREAPEYHVAKASADSHTRRMEAIKAKRAQDKAERDGTSKKGAFKAW